MTVREIFSDLYESCPLDNNIDKFVVPHHFMYEDEAHRFCELGTSGRMHPEFRRIANGDTDPGASPGKVIAAATLGKAVRHLYNAWFGRRAPVAREFYAFAIADLAVTGSRHYFGQSPADFPLRTLDFAALQIQIITDIRAEFPSAAEADIRTCIRQIYRRVFRVAWCLQGPFGFRERHREDLGWIGVSGEDDSPHRPVNVHCTSFPQFNTTISIPAGSIRPGLPVARLDINTRFVVATQSPPVASFPDEPDGLPPTPVFSLPPMVSGRRDVILFVHGHSSRAEEFDDLAPLLLAGATSRSRQLIVISFDLPCCGYSGKVNSDVFLSPLEESLPLRAGSIFAGAYSPGIPSQRFPALHFFEKFILRFIETLGLQDRLAAVIGGSLGGNMTLRLGRLGLPYLPNLVSWSAASVWNSFAETAHPIDEVAKTIALTKASESMMRTRTEEAASRSTYFNDVFGTLLDIGIYSIPRQPDQWYRDDWQPCKPIHIENSVLEREEIYHPFFRQMHWRIAFEQLVFSHRLREMGVSLHRLNRTRMLFLAGEADNYDWTGIYEATRSLAGEMTAPGECILLRRTGHSIHNERPAWFAREILNFLG